MNIKKFNSNHESAVELARLIAKTITYLLNMQPQVCIAFSGGRSPVELFKELSNYNIEWDKVTITLVDERFVATNDEDSNEYLIRKYLLINQAEKAFFIGLGQKNMHILDWVRNANLHVHKIDIAILGMGEDGHTASLFPDCPELQKALDISLTPQKYVITTPKSAKYQRIGLSLNGILEVPYLFLSINGAQKFHILEQAMQEVSYKYPISHILHKHNNLQIYSSF